MYVFTLLWVFHFVLTFYSTTFIWLPLAAFQFKIHIYKKTYNKTSFFMNTFGSLIFFNRSKNSFYNIFMQLNFILKWGERYLSTFNKIKIATKRLCLFNKKMNGMTFCDWNRNQNSIKVLKLKLAPSSSISICIIISSHMFL